jgi:ATP/ADP translocase
LRRSSPGRESVQTAREKETYLAAITAVKNVSSLLSGNANAIRSSEQQRIRRLLAPIIIVVVVVIILPIEDPSSS